MQEFFIFMELELKAKHFKDAKFLDNYNCPVARAVNEFFVEHRTIVTSRKVILKGKMNNVPDATLYIPGGYHGKFFAIDSSIAIGKAPETVIRIIELVNKDPLK